MHAMQANQMQAMQMQAMQAGAAQAQMQMQMAPMGGQMPMPMPMPSREMAPPPPPPPGEAGPLRPLRYMGMNGGQPIFQHLVNYSQEGEVMPTPAGGLILQTARATCRNR